VQLFPSPPAALFSSLCDAKITDEKLEEKVVIFFHAACTSKLTQSKTFHVNITPGCNEGKNPRRMHKGIKVHLNECLHILCNLHASSFPVILSIFLCLMRIVLVESKICRLFVTLHERINERNYLKNISVEFKFKKLFLKRCPLK
jgi:hypothetical protein